MGANPVPAGLAKGFTVTRSHKGPVMVQNLGNVATPRKKQIDRKFLAFVESEIPNDAVTPCRESSDPDLWFSPYPDDVAEAKRLCSECPFTIQCAAEALARKERHGVWGGIYRREGRVAEGPRSTGRPPVQR